jgi:hypothetical protein
MRGDALDQLIRRLDDHPTLTHQVASPKHRKGIVGERRQHVRTVRSAAWSRNRPRRRLAWLLLLILIVLLALVARVDAAPGDASIALAVRYADVLTGVEPPGDLDDLDDPDDPDDPDGPEAGGDASDVAGDTSDAAAPGDGDDSADDERRGGEAGQLAMLDAEQAPSGEPPGDDARVAASPAGAAEAHEAWMRGRMPSRWGRLDLSLAWRRRVSEPMHDLPHRLDEVWLVATWRR